MNFKEQLKVLVNPEPLSENKKTDNTNSADETDAVDGNDGPERMVTEKSPNVDKSSQSDDPIENKSKDVPQSIDNLISQPNEENLENDDEDPDLVDNDIEKTSEDVEPKEKNDFLEGLKSQTLLKDEAAEDPELYENDIEDKPEKNESIEKSVDNFHIDDDERLR